MSSLRVTPLLSLSLIALPFATPVAATTSAVEAVGEKGSPRTALRNMKGQLASAPVLEGMGTYVGQLQEKWQFPSDHLPIGMTYGTVHLASWNVLDAKYMDWVTKKNSQGLSRSQLATEHVRLEGSELTVRDQHVVRLITEMLNHPAHPKQLMALQECGDPFLAELKAALPSHFALVAHDGNALLFDTTRFEQLEVKAVPSLFIAEPERTVQDITLRERATGEVFRLLNAHLPGDPTKPSRYEFTRYLADTHNPLVTTMAMGDMNFNEIEMQDALNQAFPTENQPFSLHSPYCTNISPYVFRSKVIDHFMVAPSGTQSLRLHTPEEVMVGLEPTARLLRP